MVPVWFPLLAEEDRGQFERLSEQGQCVELRQRRLMRLYEEARDQGGLLSQEDLAELLMCNVHTIRRDIAELRERERERKKKLWYLHGVNKGI